MELSIIDVGRELRTIIHKVLQRLGRICVAANFANKLTRA